MRFYLDSVGCRLNQAEIEAYARQLRRAGHVIVDNLQNADAAILNTCAVTGQAVSDSRQKARRMGKDGRRMIILTGCWSTLAAQEAGALPGVTKIVPNHEKDDLVSQYIADGSRQGDDTIEHPAAAIERASRLIPGRRRRTRTFIKVQEGCNNRCAFCITALARGPARSRPVAGVLEDIRDALAGGTQEIVLSGVHLGSWGEDFHPAGRLSGLIRTIFMETDAPRLRLSSIEPWGLTEDFLDLWGNKRLCRHLHIPLQSGCAETLRRMARRTTPQSYACLIEAIHSAWPALAVTTDIMVGFPGETEDEFRASLEFVRMMDFSGGHVFTYSERPGTAAACMVDAVPHALRKERNRRMQEVLEQAAQRYRRRFLGTIQDVLWETVREDGRSADTSGGSLWTMEGLSGNYLRVRAASSRPIWNEISPVRLLSLEEDFIAGEIVTDI